MDVGFQMLWAHQYQNWLADEIAPPGGTFYYYQVLALQGISASAAVGTEIRTVDFP